MLVVGVRGSGRERDEGRGKERFGEVKVFLDLGFEKEKCRLRIFYLDLSL